MKIIDSLVTQAAGIASMRRDIHAHPELCFEEVRTADVVAKALTEWGIPIHRGMGTTGVVGIVHGRDGGACGRAVGLRADMDALPMQEFNTFTHASQHHGKMHACGHDGHTAMLLAAAQHLAKHRNFDGTVYLIFQPAEEGGGGAREMIKDGLFEQVPHGSRVRHAQLAGHAGGQLCRERRAGDGLEQRIQDHHPRQGRPRRAAAQRRRPGAGGLPDGAGLPDHHQPQQEAGRHGRDLGDHDPRRRGHQRGARQLRVEGTVRTFTLEVLT
jgi:hypothetical protein